LKHWKVKSSNLKIDLFPPLLWTGFFFVISVASCFAAIDVLRSDVAAGLGSKESSLMVAWNGNAFDFVYQSQLGTMQ
jgi:hypothetical protein